MRILITGGSGFIGSHLADALAKLPQHQVVVWDLRPRTYGASPDGIAFVQGDLEDTNFVRQCLVDWNIDVVYHLAWATISETALENPVADIEQNLIPTVNLLNACRYAGVKQINFVSSGGTVYGIPEELPIQEHAPTNPISPYGITKLAAEKYVQMYHHLYGLDYLIFRPSVPYGPRQNPYRRQGAVSVFTYKALRGEPIIIWGDGEVARDYFFIGDMIDALVKAVSIPEVKNLIFNLGGPRAYTLNELVHIIEETLSLKVKVTYEAARKFDVSDLRLDIKTAAEKLGWSPTTPLKKGVRHTARWIQDKIL